ncbi:hypothetical protein ABIA33_006788 [Streptacidiphilus sp. MAP12-16]|uniref:helix-turn-helix domain-containing protein n=1 Tax=Streptacidiphilus sp. MAP12-16 TaxID=3156300 RepID=UPI0035162494
MNQPVPKRSKVSGSARAELAARARNSYEGGASVRTVATEIGRSYGAAHMLLAESGVTFRSRSGQLRAPAGE